MRFRIMIVQLPLRYMRMAFLFSFNYLTLDQLNTKLIITLKAQQSIITNRSTTNGGVKNGTVNFNERSIANYKVRTHNQVDKKIQRVRC